MAQAESATCSRLAEAIFTFADMLQSVFPGFAAFYFCVGPGEYSKARAGHTSIRGSS